MSFGTAERKSKPADSLGIQLLIDTRRDAPGISPAACRAAIALVPGASGSRPAIHQACLELISLLLETTGSRRTRALEITHSANGAPRLMLNGIASELNISLSHSREWLAVAVSRHAGIGIDVECIRPTRRTLELAEFLNWPPHRAEAVDFHTFWSLWEAFYKASEGDASCGYAEAFRGMLERSTAGQEHLASGWSTYCGCLAEQASLAVVARHSDKFDWNVVHQLDHLEPW